MQDLEEMIAQCEEVREMKRALSVKMVLQGIATAQVCELLEVSPQYVSKWRVRYERADAQALRLNHRGTQGYLTAEQRQSIQAWIVGHKTLTPEGLRDHIQQQYGVLYRSKQSYYEMMHAARLSYHKSEKVNPKRDEAQVQEQRETIKKNSRSTGRRSRRVR